VARAFTDLAGLNVGADDFLAAVLETTAQPMWVVDHEGVIRYANPAAVATLGYDRADELLGRPSHETIHYKYPDGSDFPAAECPMLLPRTTGETVRRDVDWFFRRDGSMFPVSYVSAPIAMPTGRGAVVAFENIQDRLRAQQVLREHHAMLAEQQASLRRVAALVAGGAASAEVFTAIAREVAQLLDVTMVNIWRHERDGTATVMGTWSKRPHPFLPGTNWSFDAPLIAAVVGPTRAQRPGRIDDLTEVDGAFAGAASRSGVRSAVAAPIVVGGKVWGRIGAGSADRGPLPAHLEDQLAEFTELVATAIANAESRAGLARLAEEQAALRRVATLVAEGGSPAEVFDAVAHEMEALLNADQVALSRYEQDEAIVVIAHSGVDPAEVPARLSHKGQNITATVRRTGRSARLEDFETAQGTIAELARAKGVRASVGAPIVVDGQLWGVIVASWVREEPPPADTEERMAQFAQLLDTAIANADSRDQLMASRARLLTAADEARRRVVRDLHDGAQQRQVQTIATLRLAQQALRGHAGHARSLVDEALQQAQLGLADVRELAHGMLPSALTQGGLKAAVDTVVARLDLAVTVDVPAGRFPAEIEATAYFIVAEALTNVVKHAEAARATVTARVDDGTLRIEVRDDGVGGARPSGSGLVGLADRLAVLDGQLRVESPAGGGTLVAADIPLRAVRSAS
jgi:PAS domain S-box-containing protein